MKKLNLMTVNNTNTKVLCLGAHAPKAYSSLFVSVCARARVSPQTVLQKWQETERW